MKVKDSFFKHLDFVCYRCNSVIKRGNKMFTIDVSLGKPGRDRVVACADGSVLIMLCFSCASVLLAENAIDKELVLAAASLENEEKGKKKTKSKKNNADNQILTDCRTPARRKPSHNEDNPLQKETSKAERHFKRGVSYLQKGCYDLAIDEFSSAIELCPFNAAVYDKRGIAYGEKGEYDKAIADFNTSIVFDAAYEGAYNNRGLSYFKKDMITEAIKDYSRAIALKPQIAVFYFNRGLVYQYIENCEQALADFSTALELDPKNAETYCYRGEVYGAIGEFTRAAADFEAALAINPGNTIAYGNLAWLSKTGTSS